MATVGSSPALPGITRIMNLDDIYGPIQEELRGAEELFKKVLASDNEFVRQMVEHLGQSSGKRMRAALVLLTAKACGLGKKARAGAEREVKEQSLAVAEAVELIHIATLVHDDIIDNSPIRRGRKTLNFLWGNEVTVLMGDFVFAKVFQLLAQSVDRPLIRAISRATDRLCEGEIQEVRSRFLVTQGEGDYFDTIEKKTASLMAVSCEAAGMLAGSAPEQVEALRLFGLKFGTAFQIADDLLDLTADPEKLGKPQGHDIREGKITLPLLHALATADPKRRAQMQELLLLDPIDDRRLGEVVGFIRDQDGVEYARRRALKLIEEAKGLLAALPESPAKRSLLALADYVTSRDH